MEKRQTIKNNIGRGLLVIAALFLVMFPSQAGAQSASEICLAPTTADSDGDGFSDLHECKGLPLFDGITTVPGWDSIAAEKLDPSKPDLFVILVPANPSNIPANPLEFVSMSQALGGLGINVHEISAASAPDRLVSPDSPQKAVRITEDLDPEGVILGYANQGTPNGLDNAIIYTEHIKSHVYSVYGDPAAVPVGLIDTYIQHTIAHEIGHMTSLTVDYNRRFGGYHYKSGSQVIMEQAVKYTEKKGKVTFYISTQYAGPSQEGVRLK